MPKLTPDDALDLLARYVAHPEKFTTWPQMASVLDAYTTLRAPIPPTAIAAADAALLADPSVPHDTRIVLYQGGWRCIVAQKGSMIIPENFSFEE